MTLKVEKVCKKFGNQQVLDHISFSARKGEILGFLGPNGAGKSTTMKIITGFLAKSSGKVEVDGLNIDENLLDVKKRLGYLPESNPLYYDMYVKEYLHFVAKMYHLKKPMERVREMIDITGLDREKHKKIGTLSKGYKQRVGLAQAMIHRPDVLILDEPTSGLDPNQLIEIRSLIKQIGKEKTLLFSTHIMQEVEALCDRVVIIDKGKIVADDSIDGLKQMVQGRTSTIIEFSKKVDLKSLGAIDGILNIETINQNRLKVLSGTKEDVRIRLYNFSVEHKLPILEMYNEHSNVEDMFQLLTKNKQA